MTESGKVVVATALSVLAHVSFFTVLALRPSASLVPAAPEEEYPLEVTLEAAAPAPSPPPPAAAPKKEPLPVPAAQALRTQLDPENLKKSESAPEHATAIAAHHSKATPPVKAAPTPPPPPAVPQPSPDAAPPLALEPASKPSPTPAEIGIDALGNYGKAVGNAIGLRSEFYRKAQKQPLAVGDVRVQFTLDSGGRVSDVRILSNTAGAVNAACAERAVKEAHIPPIPPDRLAQVPGGRIKIVYSFSIYPTQ